MDEQNRALMNEQGQSLMDKQGFSKNLKLQILNIIRDTGSAAKLLRGGVAGTGDIIKEAIKRTL